MMSKEKIKSRDRAQLVIALGEGSEGQRLRDLFDRAAARIGEPVSAWAREILLVAALKSEYVFDKTKPRNDLP